MSHRVFIMHHVRHWHALLFLAVSIGCGKSVELPEVIIERARILMERDQMAEAIPLLNEAIAGMPDSADARYQRGVAYEGLGVLEKALVDYTECLRLDGGRTDAMNNKAVVLAKMERFEEAAAEFGRLIDLDPQEALSYRNRGLCQVDLGNYDAALADYAKALELAPDDAAGWFQRGSVYLKLERFEEAEQDYSRAIAADPALAKAWMNRGVTRYRRGEKKLAAEDLAKAQELDDNIVLPDIDFFDDDSKSTAPSNVLTNQSWSVGRSFAEKELAERGFGRLKLIREYPSMLCGEFSGEVEGQSRTIFVTCIPKGQRYLSMPLMDSEEGTTPKDCSLLVIRLPRKPDLLPAVVRYEDEWIPL